jgi:two-component system chemotaxis response regulator CheY
MNEPSIILKKINILVVDDLSSILALITTCLKELEAENIATANHGVRAWDILNKKSIDLIVCDWDMPKMTGLELLKLVKKSNSHKHIPFLLLTAPTEKHRVLEALKAGLDDYLTKPFTPKGLDFHIIKLLRKVAIKD